MRAGDADHPLEFAPDRLHSTPRGRSPCLAAVSATPGIRRCGLRLVHAERHCPNEHRQSAGRMTEDRKPQSAHVGGRQRGLGRNAGHLADRPGLQEQHEGGGGDDQELEEHPVVADQPPGCAERLDRCRSPVRRSAASCPRKHSHCGCRTRCTPGRLHRWPAAAHAAPSSRSCPVESPVRCPARGPSAPARQPPRDPRSDQAPASIRSP